MARPRVFIKHELPREVVSIAVAFITDYRRRERELERGVLSEHLLSTYKNYNEIIDNAASVLEPGMREEMLSDIISGRGYEHSMIGWMCAKESYYLRKREVVYRVARGLGLCE